jgi:peptidoglycan/LPS O-acetylase OafA/YrhL
MKPAEKPPRSEPASDRAVEIDGIRGWAALIVLLYHVFWEMLGHVLPQIRNTATGVLLNGGTAVSIFFVLSGDALSAAYFKTRDPRSVDRLLVKRYFRLTVPIFFSCLLVFILMRLGWDYHLRAASLVHSEEWLGDVLEFRPTSFNLLEYALRDVYIHHTKQGSYNPILWTMPIEMIGSMLVFLLCYVWDRLRRPSWIVSAMTASCFAAAAPYCLFGVGVLLGYARQRGLLEQLRNSTRWQIVCIAVAALAFGLSALYRGNHASALVATLLVVVFYTHRLLRRFFVCSLSRYLGAISFPLYLVHFPVIISLMSWMLISSSEQPQGLDTARLGLIALSTVAVSLVAATAFRQTERFVLERLDGMLLRLLR